jgi:hypothetical protein
MYVPMSALKYVFMCSSLEISTVKLKDIYFYICLAILDDIFRSNESPSDPNVFLDKLYYRIMDKVTSRTSLLERLYIESHIIIDYCLTVKFCPYITYNINWYII